jgi:uncharacterized protein YndB with AHSA1/START domain
MPPRPQEHVATQAKEYVAAKTMIDKATNTIVFTRIIDAPREDVFEAWTKPEHVACWWDASGKHLAECVINLQPGGTFKFVGQEMNGAPPFTGTYREILPPERLVFEAMGAIGSVDFAVHEGKTRLTVRIKCGSAEHLEQFVKMGVDVGTAQTLDNLVQYIKR